METWSQKWYQKVAPIGVDGGMQRGVCSGAVVPKTGPFSNHFWGPAAQASRRSCRTPVQHKLQKKRRVHEFWDANLQNLWPQLWAQKMGLVFDTITRGGPVFGTMQWSRFWVQNRATKYASFACFGSGRHTERNHWR